MAIGRTDFGTGAIRVPDVGSLFTQYSNTMRQREEADKNRAMEEAQRAVNNRMAQDRLGISQGQLALSQSADARAAEQTRINNALKNPNSPESIALRRANLDTYEQQKQIDAKYRPKDKAKPRLFDMYRVDDKGGIVSVKATPEEAGTYAQSGFKLGNYKAPTKGKGSGGTSNSKARENIAKIIGSVGNPDDVAKARNEFITKGGTDKEFYTKLLEVGGGSLDEKGLLDFGKKDLNVSPILNSMKNQNLGQNLKGEVTTQPVLREQPKQFELPKIGATALKASIAADIKALENPWFGSRKIDSAVKEKIDAKYGIGAYDAMKPK